MAEIRVGVAGLTHGHVGGLVNAWSGVEGAKLVAVADRTPLLDQYKERFERSYTDYREMLDKETLDALVVTSDNAESSRIAVEALERGIPCLVEKAMAKSAADADLMLEAQRKSGKTLMINWPLAWNGWVNAIRESIHADTIGHTFHMRFRIGHHGPREIGCDQWFVAWLYDESLSGGGAVADFGCYGAVLSRWYFGMPESVYCLKGNYTKDYDVPDDYATLVLKYPKRTVVLEGTWATRVFDDGPNPVVHGKEGSIWVKGSEVFTKVGDGEAVVTAPALDVKNPAAYFWNCVQTGAQPEGILNPEIAADACRILDAAVRSSRSGCAEAPI